jgi:hypothetical protein
MNKETEMNNRYLKQDKWLDATACGWCDLSDPARCGESWRVEYNNGYECDGTHSLEPSAATCEIRMNASYNGSATFDKEGLQVFVAACTEALEMILEHERDPKYPDNKVYTLPHNCISSTQEEPKS